MPTIKLHAHLAHLGIASRRKAEEMIAEGKVSVNGERGYIGQRIDPAKDQIELNQKLVSSPNKTIKPLYYLINKPKGYLSTTADELGRKTVLDIIPETKNRLYPVGRLDQDSEGLMLLTNDGDLTHRLTHPSFEQMKTYHIRIDGIPTTKALDHLRRGVKLKEGYTRPADVDVLKHEGNTTWLSITIHEGWNHQVKRMLSRVGYEVTRLIRYQMGPFTLDMLRGQHFLQLSPADVKQLLQ